MGSYNESGVNCRVVLLKHELIVSVDELANDGVIFPAQAIIWSLVVPIVSRLSELAERNQIASETLAVRDVSKANRERSMWPSDPNIYLSITLYCYR